MLKQNALPSLWGPRSPFRSRASATRLVVIALCVGLTAGTLLAWLIGLTGTIFVIAALLAVPVAVGKTATACGMNVIGSVALSPQGAPQPRRIVLYVLASTAASTAIGVCVAFIGELLGAQRALVLAPAALAIAGLRELGWISWLPVPTSTWQVPARWVTDATIGPIRWGLLLGNGLATWMPHAGFYALLFLAFVLPFPHGALALGIYGAARATPAIGPLVSPRLTASMLRPRMMELRLGAHAVIASACFAGAAAILANVIPNWR